MFLIWTVAAASVIDGVHGRYFLPVFIFLLFALFELLLKFDRKKIKNFLLIFSLSIVLTSITIGTYKRYYDYSRVYQNLEDLKNSYQIINIKDIELVQLNSEKEFEITTHNGKFSGLQFVSRISEGSRIQIPYAYSLYTLDGKIIEKGYLPVSRVSGNGITQIDFKIIEVEGSKIMFKISPVMIDEKQDYVSILRNKKTNQPLINLLYVR